MKESKNTTDVYKGQSFWNIFFSIVFILVSFYISYMIVQKTPNLIKNITLFEFTFISLASFRLIRLFTYDKIMDFMRGPLSRNENGIGRTLYEIIICPWCTGIWVTLVVIVVYFFIPYGNIFIFIVGISGVASLIQSFSNMMGRVGYN